jgi:ABC-type dipeptide/oligopeptide/nickel transport system permease subunit
MGFIKKLFAKLLNPRANLENVPHSNNKDTLEGYETPAGARGMLSLKDLLTNFSLMLGVLIVFVLFLLVLFGPVWAPQNPYITGQHIVPHYDIEAGEFINPPLPPSPEFPFGTNQYGSDQLSMLMYGTRNTLIACAFITMARMLLGVTLGGLAGWREGSFADRIVMGTIGVITSVPLLVSSMVIIFALDIRRGMPVFIMALSVIGWTEIAQYIRSEFMILREAPYIEGARSVGLQGIGIAVRHILPNILPQLMIIAFLEMGAVLMLLGELGFVGVYIGGGSEAVLSSDFGGTRTVTMIDMPEWGAMLAEGFRFLRSKPFVVFPSAVAFFIAVLGFTSLGEGLRRLVERHSINTGFLLKKEMLLFVAGLTAATVYIINNTGPAPWISKVAQSYNGEAAYEHTRILVEMNGRRVGQEGGELAAQYIAESFEDYGLEPGWVHNQYVYQIETLMVEPQEQPYLAVLGDDGNVVEEYRHQIDFGYLVEGHGGAGDIQYPVTFIGFLPGQTVFTWDSFKGLDLRDRIVVLVQGNAPRNFAEEALIRGARGILWIVTNEKNDVISQYQAANPDKNYLRPPILPIYRARTKVIDTLLSQDGLTLEEVFRNYEQADQVGVGWFRFDLTSQVHMRLKLKDPEPTQVPIVLGYTQGSDLDVFDELIIVFVSYDGLGVDLDGTIFPSANQGASAVGIMLELARLWHEAQLDTRRPVMFLAWGGVALDYQMASVFTETVTNFRHLNTPAISGRVEPSIILQLDYAGQGGNSILIDTNFSGQLSDLLEETASEVETPIMFVDSEDVGGRLIARNLPGIYVQWSDSEVTSPELDIFENIQLEKMQSYGEVVSLLMTKLVRLSDF